MDVTKHATLEVSFPKALMVSSISMACFAIAVFIEVFPFGDRLLVGFFIIMLISMTFVFAAGLCFLLRCKIGFDGLHSATTFYRRLLRWEDITVVQGFGSPFFFVRGRAFKDVGHYIIPRRFLLKRPESLKESIEKYAPADNIVRKKLLG